MTVAQESEARQNLDFTRHRIEVLTGQSMDTLARLDVQARFQATQPVPTSVDAWMERAEQGSPDCAHCAQLEAARQEVDKANSGHLPTLDAVAQWPAPTATA